MQKIIQIYTNISALSSAQAVDFVNLNLELGPAPFTSKVEPLEHCYHLEVSALSQDVYPFRCTNTFHMFNR